MGLLEDNPLDWLRGSAAGRCQADRGADRAAGGGARAAPLRRSRRIRATLAAEGILLEDKPDGTTTWWRKD